MTETAPRHPGLDELIDTVQRLRAPDGCPWDAEQTHASLVRYLVEECYELVEAIESGDRAELVEELGDVLYQVLFHADIAAHTPGEGFDIDDVARHMTAKMIGRHPHVFGDREAETAEDVMGFWEELKRAEKPHRTSVLDGVPAGMPALALADKVIGKAGKLGVAPDAGTGPAADAADEEALGAELFGIVAAARAKGLDPERALRGAIRAFAGEVRRAEAAGSGADA
ncbi:MazG family protein [Agromyces archimandritae]|uniref:MazG family protein n=1 Tax=Agromyces archimandritae TaxID=2781962 RepID=A0A975FLJ3_9MICO|nr:MazG family protein [Agromyces archimandritae]QTX04154.1 MazG family protein [Agromyces archimandritae]